MAIKLAFKNKPDRHNIIVLQDAYHGRSLTTMARVGHTRKTLSCRFNRASRAFHIPTLTGLGSI